MHAKEVAAITGITVRTLHYYDKIGLLCPRRNQQNGYRFYLDEDLDQLQQILFFKACGFSLASIQQMLNRPDFDREKAFELQRNYLLHEKKRIDTMLDTLDKTRKAMKGEMTMSQKEKFGGFDFTSNPYEEEARRLWGEDAVNQSNHRIESLSETEQSAIGQGMHMLFTKLAKLRNDDPRAEQSQAAIDEMYQHFNQNFGYFYTLEAFAGLGQMYVQDSRFTKNIDQYGAGLAAFLAEAMAVYAQIKKS